jgi:hypothetical protein
MSTAASTITFDREKSLFIVRPRADLKSLKFWSFRDIEVAEYFAMGLDAGISIGAKAAKQNG